ECQGLLEGIDGTGLVMLVQRNDKPGNSERRGVIATRCDCRASMMDRNTAILFLQPCAESEMITPGKRRVRSGVSGFEFEGFLQEGDGLRCILGNVAVGNRQSP